MCNRSTQRRRAVLAGAATGVAASLTALSASRAAVVVTAVNSGSETVSNGTYNVIDFYVSSLTGVDAMNQSNGGTGTAGLLDLQGTFSATTLNTAMLAVPGDSNTSSPGYFAKYTDNATTPPSGYGTSFVNFSGETTVSRTGTGASTLAANGRSATAVTGNSPSFAGTYANLDGSTVPASATNSFTNLLAEVLVTPGGGVSFSGVYGSYGSNGAALAFAYTPAGSPSTTPLISLTTGAPTGYGSQVGTVNLTGKGTGNYNATTAAFTATNTGYVAVTGFTPATDTEVYGLRVLEGGSPITGADLTTLIGDINAAGGSTSTNGTVVASAVTAPFTTEFPGSVIELTVTGAVNGSPFLGFNLVTAPGITGALTVTSVAAVPEPASIAFVSIAATGLLSGRRRRRA